MDSNVPVAPPSGKNGNQEATTAQPAPVHGAVLHADRIAKNTSYLTVALIFQKVISLVYFVYISRTVGPQNVGYYLSAIAVTTVLGFFIDLNFSQALIRETAKKPEKTNEYLNAAVTIKCFTAVLAYAVALLYVHLFHLPAIVQSLVVITGLIMILDSLTLSFYSIFRGHQKLQYEAIGTIVNKIIVTTFGVIGLRLGYGVHLLVLAILAGSAFNLVYVGILLFRKLQWRPRLRGVYDDVRYLAKIVVPWFALGGIFVTIYGYIDQVLLSNPLLVGARGASYLSWYGTAYKLTFAFQFLPAAVVAAFFPAMSAYFISDKEKLKTTFERSLSYLLILSVPLSLGIYTLADRIILSLYTRAYTASIFPLQILILSIVFIFLNYPVGYLLNAADRQRRNTIHVGIAMVVNILLNLFLIPRFTFVGAAISSTISSVLLVTLGLIVAKRIVAFRSWPLLVTALKTVVAAGTMAVGLWYLKHRSGLFTLIPLAVLWYFVVLLLLRGIRISDGVSLYQSVKRKVVHVHDDETRPVSHS
ncbi:MAG: flippase [bacterium]